MNHKRRKRLMPIIISILIILTLFCLWQNNDIVITNYDYNNSKIPTEFNDFKILQVSDLHNKKFGKNQSRLIKLTKEISPDIIVITGDLIDKNRTNINISIDFIKEASKLSTIYYVSGNHEEWSGQYEKLSQELISFNVIILDDKRVELVKNSQTINLIGMSDPSFINSDYTLYKDNLNNLVDINSFNLLLSHRPELFDLYTDSNVDLALTGHAHGGQFRLPFIGGLIAPNQGLFPTYTRGIYQSEETSMIVSRGLGNSIMPIRLFNRPELVVVTLNSN